jgi:hypothetical protein
MADGSWLMAYGRWSMGPYAISHQPSAMTCD